MHYTIYTHNICTYIYGLFIILFWNYLVPYNYIYTHLKSIILSHFKRVQCVHIHYVYIVYCILRFITAYWRIFIHLFGPKLFSL